MAPKDEDTVTFISSRNKKKTEYRLEIKCQSGLTDKEFAVALHTFANDIDSGNVTFDLDGEAQDNSLQ